jgi:dienelactone hydrolase
VTTKETNGEERVWPVNPIETTWDDLLEGVDSPGAWEEKRRDVKGRFLELLRDEFAPKPPKDLDVVVEREWDGGGFRILDVSYQVEEDERAHAYIGMPEGPAPEGLHPGVVCLHGTTNWGARRTLGLLPEVGDPHADRVSSGLDYARQLVRHGYVTISPEHFCCARRMPEAGPFETEPLYQKHPNWTAVGKYMYDSRIACDVLCALPEVDASRLGVTGHSLGAHGSIWLAAYDDRIRCAAPSCSAQTFRENPEPLHWARDHWYVYLPQLREVFLAGEQAPIGFHEMMALIAPRPFLDRFALNDGCPLTQGHRVMLHVRLRELYRMLGAEPAHAFLVSGDGHSISDMSCTTMLSWMDRWLKHDGAPSATWDATPATEPPE